MPLTRAVLWSGIIAILALPASGGVAPAVVAAKATLAPATTEVTAATEVTPTSGTSAAEPATARPGLRGEEDAVCRASSTESEWLADARRPRGCVPWGRLCDPYQNSCCGGLQCHFDGYTYSCRF